MKTTKVIFSFFLLAIILTACNMPGVGDRSAGFTEDKVYPVEYFADKGILQGHDRYDTEYRDLAAGSASLSSGSFLRTLNGEAFIVLPGDSILKLGANTEVQVGLYEDGIIIWQHSGETLHITTAGKEGNYLVATPFGMVQPFGTEYEIRVDYPSQGWVAVYWGEIGLVQTDPAPIYGLVPEGVLFINPSGASEYMRLQPGDTVTWEIDPVTGLPLANFNMSAPDVEAQHNRELARRIRELMRQYQDGIIDRESYHAGLNGILNEALGLSGTIYIPGVESGDVTQLIPLGGLYGGMVGNQAVTLCYDGSYVTRVTWFVELQCTDLVTNESYIRSDVFSMGLDAIMPVSPGGVFDIIYTVDPAISVDTAWSIQGVISSGGGSVTMSIQSQSDVEFCGIGFTTFPLNPTGTECTSE